MSNNNNNNNPKRNFILSKDVRAESVEDIIKGIIEVNKFDEMNEKGRTDYIRKPIEIIVSTYGGSCYEAFGLIGVMDSSATPIHTYCYSKAMSMGVPIFSAGHKRFAHKLATFMYHQVSSGMHGKLGDLEIDVDEAKRLNELYVQWVLETTNIPEIKMRDSIAKKYDWFFTAEEGLKMGLVDEIIESKVKRGVK